MSGCKKLGDEDSRDVEEEDDPEDEESFSEVKSSIDCVGRRNWRVRIFITPPDSSFCQKTLNNTLTQPYLSTSLHSTGGLPKIWRISSELILRFCLTAKGIFSNVQ